MPGPPTQGRGSSMPAPRASGDRDPSGAASASAGVGGGLAYPRRSDEIRPRRQWPHAPTLILLGRGQRGASVPAEGALRRTAFRRNLDPVPEAGPASEEVRTDLATLRLVPHTRLEARQHVGRWSIAGVADLDRSKGGTAAEKMNDRVYMRNCVASMTEEEFVEAFYTPFSGGWSVNLDEEVDKPVILELHGHHIQAVHLRDTAVQVAISNCVAGFAASGQPRQRPQ